MSEFHTEQHFELICNPNDANMIDSLLNREDGFATAWLERYSASSRRPWKEPPP